MKNALIILLFTLGITYMYYQVGMSVPQKEVAAPEAIEVGDTLTPEQMVEIGGKIANSPTCQSCHAIQPRFPTLEGIGGRAASRIEGYSDVEYLAESLYEPDKFIVPSFAKGMTPANKPPMNLSDKEILTVIAYLQSQGGAVTVSMDTELKYKTEGGGGAPKPAADAPAASGGNRTGQAILEEFGCLGCHSMDTPDPMVGPTLYDIGAKLSKSELYESLMDPDATIAEGFMAGVMGATLDANGFYAKVSSSELKTLVDFLAEMKGEKKEGE